MKMLSITGKIILMFAIVALSLVIEANILTYLPPYWALPAFIFVAFLAGWGLYRITE